MFSGEEEDCQVNISNSAGHPRHGADHQPAGVSSLNLSDNMEGEGVEDSDSEYEEDDVDLTGVRERSRLT
jgi:hypothetical protein